MTVPPDVPPLSASRRRRLARLCGRAAVPFLLAGLYLDDWAAVLFGLILAVPAIRHAVYRTS